VLAYEYKSTCFERQEVLTELASRCLLTSTKVLPY